MSLSLALVFRFCFVFCYTVGCIPWCLVLNRLIPSFSLQGHFLAWHRYFVAAYEKALREECGYDGAQPYGQASDFRHFYISPLP